MRLWVSAAVTAVLTVGVMPAPPSSAETVRRRDRSHDVQYIERDAPPEAVQRADGDIARYRFTYTNRRFRAVVHFRALRRNAPARYLSVNLRYKSDIQFEYLEAEVNTSPDLPQGRAELNGGRVRCRHVHHRVDYRRDAFRISFAARCLQSTPVLDASVVSVVSDAPGDDATYHYIDRAPEPGTSEFDGVRVRRG